MTNTNNNNTKVSKPKSVKVGGSNTKPSNIQNKKGGYIDPSMSIFNSFPLLTAGKNKVMIKDNIKNLKNETNIDLKTKSMYDNIMNFKNNGKEVSYTKNYTGGKKK